MPVAPDGDRVRDLTVARVRDRPGMDFVEVMFLESPRIFHLSRSRGRFVQLLSKLREAERAGGRVRVTFATADDGDIADVAGV